MAIEAAGADVGVSAKHWTVATAVRKAQARRDRNIVDEHLDENG
jgi:hypothetical protein